MLGKLLKKYLVSSYEFPKKVTVVVTELQFPKSNFLNQFEFIKEFSFLLFFFAGLTGELHRTQQ